MCNEWSAIIDSDCKVYCQDGQNSHSELMKLFNLPDTVSDKDKLQFARVEVVPKDRDYVRGVDVSVWGFRLDEAVKPDWWTADHEIEVMTEFKKYHKRKYKKLKDGRFKMVGWYSKGKKEYEYFYKDGERDGKQVGWYSNGKKSSEHFYKDGELEGKQVGLHSNGKKEYEYFYKDGERDGKQVGWYSNGKKEYEHFYKDGERDGKQVGWYSNGKKSYEYFYKDGERDGKQVGWYSNGKKSSEHFYKDGKQVS